MDNFGITTEYKAIFLQLFQSQAHKTITKCSAQGGRALGTKCSAQGGRALGTKCLLFYVPVTEIIVEKLPCILLLYQNCP